MMRKRLPKVFALAGITAVVVSLLIPHAVFAGGPPETVTPTIEVQEDGWLVISFGGQVKDKVSVARQLDAYLVEALDKMNSSAKSGGYSILGYDQMYDSEQQNFGNSYVYGSFTTTGSWSSSPASFSGTSSQAWYGTVPDDVCLMRTEHTLVVSDGGYFDTNYKPSTGYWEVSQAYAWGAYETPQLGWYLGTAWNNLKGTWGAHAASIDQETLVDYNFEPSQYGDPLPMTPSDWMWYGED